MVSYFSRNQKIFTGILFVCILTSYLTVGACSFSKKTAVMANIGGINYTAEQLRLRVADFVTVLSGMIERGADEIIENSSSADVRWNALQWKANALPVTQTAAFQFDPLIGLFDLWAFVSQMREFFEDGNGSHLFGNQQFVAIRTIRKFDEEISQFIESFGSSWDLGKAKANVEEWVRNNPIENILFVRRSTNVSLAEYSKDETIPEVLGGLDERMTDMTTRMNLVMQQMPKIGRWQGQLFIADQVRRPAVKLFDADKLFADMKPAMESFEKVTNLVPKMPEFIEQQREALKNDIQVLTKQILMDSQLRVEETIQNITLRSQYLVDYIFIRLVILLALLGLILFIFAILLKRRGPSNPAKA